jgi:REP element-mobilizing transposase RayT
MPSQRVAADLNAETYYLTLTIQRWYYLFDRYNRWRILAGSLRYCQENKRFELNGTIFMLNHIHLIATSPDMAGFTESVSGSPRKRDYSDVDGAKQEDVKT